MIISMYSAIRDKLFRTTKTRKFIICKKYFLKIYSNAHEAEYEYKVLKEIRATNSRTFTVPKPLKLIKTNESSILVMERVAGYELEGILNRVLLSEDRNLPRIFVDLGKALKELHSLPLEGLNKGDIPFSWDDLKAEISRRSKEILDYEIKLESITNGYGLDDEIFKTANLHGEAYFTHIMISNGRFIFVDFHKACKGPAFYDLSVFDISLRNSILLPPKSESKLDLIANALWKGYFGEKISKRSIRIGELYAALSAIEALLHDRGSWSNKMANSLKLRKLRNFIFSVEQESIA